MSEGNCDVTHVTSIDEFPAGLKNAAEISAMLGLAENRVIELADARIIPHWRIEDGAPLFKPAEVRKWVAKNMMHRFDGSNLPIQLRVMIDPPQAKDAPQSIREIKNLKEVPIHEYPPGVYFLVGEHSGVSERVLYIGQSLNPIARIGDHRKSKTFERAYMIPVPSFLLDAVEGALIRAFNPPLNSGKQEIAYGPGNPRHDADVINRFAEGAAMHLDRRLT